jgi:nucleoside-diphosphate-sugar epimerase
MRVSANKALDSMMFAWAAATKQPRVVYFSSSAAYPASIQVPEHKCTESDIDFKGGVLLPDETYGWAKLSGEVDAIAARREGVKVHVVRPFSSYGPDQDEGYPIPDFLRRALRQEDPFTLWGTGRQVRDYVWVEDLVETVLRMVEEDIEGPLNIGSGRPVDFWELASIVTGVAGYSPTIVADTTKPVGVQYRCCDTAWSHLLHKPTVSLEDGIEECYRWLMFKEAA